MRYCPIHTPDPGHQWNAFYSLSQEEVLSTLQTYRRKGWRPDVISPHFEAGRLRFMLVTVENVEDVDWRFRLDMSVPEYQKESAVQKSLGLFPLTIVSYGDEAKVRYAAIWVRFRTAGNQTPASAAPDPKAQAERLAHALSWHDAQPNHFYGDPLHSLKDVLDFREIAGVDPKELDKWQAGLGNDFHLSHVSSRSGTGPALLNAVAVRQRTPHPVRFHPEVDGSTDAADRIWRANVADGFQYASVGMYLKVDQKTASTTAQLWVKDSVSFWGWYDGLDGQIEFARNGHTAGNRVAALSSVTTPDGGPSYVCVMREDPPGRPRPWEIFYRLTAEEVLPTVEYYQRRGWRPDVLAAHWDGDQVRFMLVLVDNPEKVDWRFRTDMSLKDYEKESAEQKRQGLFPLAITSYGNQAHVRHAGIWVRYRAP
jgi:hypothetical protein